MGSFYSSFLETTDSQASDGRALTYEGASSVRWPAYCSHKQ